MGRSELRIESLWLSSQPRRANFCSSAALTRSGRPLANAASAAQAMGPRRGVTYWAGDTHGLHKPRIRHTKRGTHNAGACIE
jgi:hypothetical protein